MYVNQHCFKNFDRSLNDRIDVMRFVDDVYDHITRWSYDFTLEWNHKDYGVSDVEKAQLDALNARSIEIIGISDCYSFLMGRQNEDND